MLVWTGGAYDATVQRLSLAEQAEFHTYQNVMTAAQVRTSLAQPSAAARTAYLRQWGLGQRFAALDPRDRDALRSGVPHVGMSADTLRFLWGEPEYTVHGRPWTVDSAGKRGTTAKERNHKNKNVTY